MSTIPSSSPKVVKFSYYMPRPLRPVKGKPTCVNCDMSETVFLYATYMQNLPPDQAPASYDGASMVTYDDGSRVVTVIVGINGRPRPGEPAGVLKTFRV